MRYLILGVGLSVAWLAVGPCAQGQVTVDLSLERDTYVLYEAIPLFMRIQNLSARPVKLHPRENGRSWLDLQVFHGEADLARSLKNLEIDEELVIGPNETLTRQINLTPLFELRSRGTIRVQALIRSGEISAASAVLKFVLINSREVWKQTIGVKGETESEDSYRTYALAVRRGADHEYLYVCVRDDDLGLVYGMIPMGAYISLQPPQVQIDPMGFLHVLFRQGPRALGYAKVDIYARLLSRAVYSDYSSQPSLVRAADGAVSVSGGEKIYPRDERVMSNQELNPPPPPPEPPAKKSWWPFGGK